MKVLARRGRATFLHELDSLRGELHSLAFDGYTLTVNFKTPDGRDVRLELERHEAVRVQAYVADRIARQRADLRELQRVTDSLA